MGEALIDEHSAFQTSLHKLIKVLHHNLFFLIKPIIGPSTHEAYIILIGRIFDRLVRYRIKSQNNLIDFLPLWKLLLDLDSQALVQLLDLSYLEDEFSPEEVVGWLDSQRSQRSTREAVLQRGYPGYDTSV